MTNFYKAYCRVFQKVMFIAECFMPWGEPFMLTGPGSIRKLPNLIKEKGPSSYNEILNIIKSLYFVV